MPEYDFHQLSPYDLEILARDLLQAHWGVTIESFKTGKDRGIDLRYAAGSGKIIVQVKHFLRTGLAGLMRELTKEAAKVRRLKPTRYVLGSRLIDFHSQKMTVAARATAERKVVAHLS